MKKYRCISTVSLLLLEVFAVAADRLPFPNAQSVNLWRLEKRQAELQALVNDEEQVVFKKPKFSEFPPQWFEQPLDHFSKDSPTFGQRYWVSKRHYKKGGPVIVLDGGETSGENRLLFLDTGIVDILAKATNGLGVILEHRYYGESIAVPDLSTDSLRWLNNDQSAADSANFMRNVKFEGIDENLSAEDTPWIYYGGSYAGARAAHMRVLYPDIVFGAIASSGVTHASLENWEYMDIIRAAAEPECSQHLVTSIAVIDGLLAVPRLRGAIKGLFGLAELEHDDDFAGVIESPLGSWQSKNWDPKLGSTKFDQFCEALAKPLGKLNATQSVSLAGGLDVPVTVWNYANYIKENYVSKCPEDATIEDCFGSYDDSKFQGTDLSLHWRLWLFQVCTEWGYFVTAPPDPEFPRIVSRQLTLETQSRICQQAYPPGKHFQVPALPNITAVNVLGDFAIAADRLAIIDGEVDPWRPDTPHSQNAEDRNDTILQPFKLIPNAVHHYDEYGLTDIRDEPLEIMQIHLEMIHFVKEWLKDWDTVLKERRQRSKSTC
ncbi:peptidase S28 [Schizopora paradoxa]|uniref:Peptidase S28 n=1 Tax=Schizopora paradoxa TaxID=27342 RepID=A0A0H2SCR2_9AGAM|nr:peptidase S28 [Schizopora paradoxa]